MPSSSLYQRTKYSFNRSIRYGLAWANVLAPSFKPDILLFVWRNSFSNTWLKATNSIAFDFTFHRSYVWGSTFNQNILVSSNKQSTVSDCCDTYRVFIYGISLLIFGFRTEVQLRMILRKESNPAKR